MYSPPSLPLYDTSDLRPSTIHSTSVLPPSLPPASGRTRTLTTTFPLPSFCAGCLSVAGLLPETASAIETSSPISSNVVADAYDPCAEEFLLRGEGGFKRPLLDSRANSVTSVKVVVTSAVFRAQRSLSCCCSTCGQCYPAWLSQPNSSSSLRSSGLLVHLQVLRLAIKGS